jgi:hypothetical protein
LGNDYTLTEPEVIKHQRDNVLRLLVERHHIWAKVYNPGGSVILTATDRVDHERPTGYRTEVGNPDHLDLIDLDKSIRDAMKQGVLSKQDLVSMLLWVDSMTDEQAAVYLHSKGSSRIRYSRRPVDTTREVSGEVRPVPPEHSGLPTESPGADT